MVSVPGYLPTSLFDAAPINKYPVGVTLRKLIINNKVFPPIVTRWPYHYEGIIYKGKKVPYKIEKRPHQGEREKLRRIRQLKKGAPR